MVRRESCERRSPLTSPLPTLLLRCLPGRERRIRREPSAALSTKRCTEQKSPAHTWGRMQVSRRF